MNQNQEALNNFSLALKYLSLQDPIYEVVDRIHYGQILAGRIFREMGILYCEDQEWEKALESFDKAVQMNAEDLSTYIRRGNLYRREEKWENALKDYRIALSLSKREGKDVTRIERIIQTVEKNVENR